MMRYPYGYMPGEGIIVGIVCLIVVLAVLALIGLAIAWLVRQSSAPRRVLPPPPAPPGAFPDPLDIAKRRLAAGEITPEQFEEIRKRLV